jgi:hypothetical protein
MATFFGRRLPRTLTGVRVVYVGNCPSIVRRRHRSAPMALSSPCDPAPLLDGAVMLEFLVLEKGERFVLGLVRGELARMRRGDANGRGAEEAKAVPLEG